MKEYIQIFETSPLFSGLEPQEIEKALACFSAVERRYRKGKSIFRLGETVSGPALLLEGCAHIQKEDYWGNLSILSEIGPGELFGEVYACLGDEPMAHNVVAVRDSVVLFLDLRRLLETRAPDCGLHGRITQNFIRVLAEKNRRLTQKLEHMSRRTTREKLLSYLSEQSLYAQSASFVIPFNRQQLADYLSVERSAMSAELGRMRDEGLLTFERSRFTLYSPGQQFSRRG